eukprot:s7586_g1.t1
MQLLCSSLPFGGCSSIHSGTLTPGNPTSNSCNLLYAVISDLAMAPPRSAFPAEGTRFGLHDDSFELGTELGGGSQGRVYACKRLGTGNEYAVKIVNTKAIGLRERTMASLRREISVMRELHHPRIVNLKEAFWEGNLCYIVMDLARGGDLHSKLEPAVGLGSEQSSRHVSLQLLGGIAYMHLHKVIHRDLKPENVLIVRSFCGPEPLRSEMHEVKIADFGLSKCLRRVGEQEAGMTACGTLDYLAPEVVTGQYDERIDFWSFGVLLYIMLSGRLPFEIEGVADIKRLSGESLTFQGAWRSVSEHARSFVQGLLRVDPADRFDQKGCLSHPWLAHEASTMEGSVTCSDTDTSPLEIDSPTEPGGYRHKELFPEPCNGVIDLAPLDKACRPSSAASKMHKLRGNIEARRLPILKSQAAF